MVSRSLHGYQIPPQSLRGFNIDQRHIELTGLYLRQNQDVIDQR